MKRFLDGALAAVLLLVLSPLILVLSLLIFAQDGRSPFYVAERVGRGGRAFRMVKFRSMVVNADRSGVMSTAAGDRRITPIGRFVRRFKLDEVPQLWNVLKGEMSFVGPRPNVEPEVRLYSDVERGLLSVRPGVTDIASIVFADEADILEGREDPNRAYNLLIRPGKSRLGLHYVAHRSLGMDLRLMVLTARAVASRPAALEGVARLLERSGAPADLVALARRREPLTPSPPPGVTEETWERHLTYVS